jgi:uncharacterized protein (TIGR00369 family)
MSEDPSQAALLARAGEFVRGTMIDWIGYRLRELHDGRAVAEIDFRPDLTQVTGLFHAGAILTLADTTATWASLSIIDPNAAVDPANFSFTVQISANMIGNTAAGKLIAEAVTVHPGRTTHVIETKIHDQAGKLIAVVTTTHLIVRRNPPSVRADGQEER